MENLEKSEQPQSEKKNENLEQQIIDLAPYVERFLRSKLNCPENDVRDVTQDVLINATRAADRFESKSTLKTWITAIARNTYFNFARKMKKRSEIHLGMQSDDTMPTDFDENYIKDNRLEGTDDKSPSDLLSMNEDREVLMAAIDKLDPIDKSIILDKFYHELSTEDLADKYAMPEGTIRSRLFYIKRKIRGIMESEIRS